MMKKLLTLFLVLAMASITSAASIELGVNGDPYTGQDVIPSEWIQLTLVDTDVITFPPPIASTAGVEISVSLGDEASMTFPLAPTMGTSLITVVGDGFTWDGNATWIMGALPGDEVFVLQWHVPDGTPFSTDINVDWGFIYNEVTYAGSEVLHVVPEPMTLCLLGLGGLFLRRRKK